MAANYSVVADVRDGIEVYTLRAGDGATAEIAPAFGCNCFSFGAEQPILEPVAFAEFRQRPTSYGIPILFPFPNRIRDGRFTFQGRTFELNPPRHGFVRDKAWQVLDHGASDERGAWLTAGFDARDHAAQILAQFPFPFRLEVTYRLKDATLEMETIARNDDTAEMPAGFGIHPYFRKPAHGTLTVPAGKRWELADSLPTGRLLDVAGAYDLRAQAELNGLLLDDIYTNVTAEADGQTRCYLMDADAGRETVVEFDAARFPHVVVYTPPAPRQAICVEPNTCPTDAFNLQARGIDSNMLVLRAGEEMRFNVRLYSRDI
jgi:aldose 1-epimerase